MRVSCGWFLILRVFLEEAFKSTHVEIIGISPDSVEKQAKFVKDNKLNVCTPFFVHTKILTIYSFQS